MSSPMPMLALPITLDSTGAVLITIASVGSFPPPTGVSTQAPLSQLPLTVDSDHRLLVSIP